MSKSPPNGGKGRPKGARNRHTVAVKEALEQAFVKLGGVPALVEWATVNPGDFYKLWAKCLPLQVELNRAAPAPHTQPINDPNVLDAALAFDAAVAGTHPARAGQARPPVPHLGEVSPSLATALDEAVDQAVAVSTGAPEGGQTV